MAQDDGTLAFLLVAGGLAAFLVFSNNRSAPPAAASPPPQTPAPVPGTGSQTKAMPTSVLPSSAPATSSVQASQASALSPPPEDGLPDIAFAPAGPSATVVAPDTWAGTG